MIGQLMEQKSNRAWVMAPGAAGSAIRRLLVALAVVGAAVAALDFAARLAG